MEPTVEIDTSVINRAVAELVRRTRISRADWIKVEGAAILDKCITWTRMATVGAVNKSTARQARYVTNREGSRTAWLTHTGVIWVYSRKSDRYLKAGTLNPITNTGSVDPSAMGGKLGRSLQVEARDALRRARARTRDNLDAAKKARGLAVQSWVQIADSTGLPIKETKKVATARKARASNGIYYRNGHSATVEATTRYSIRMVNQLPYNAKIGMGDMFGRAMKTRETYLKQNIKRGVFEDMSKVAARYPGLRALNN